MIPGLENGEFVRYGVMHRNSYMDSPNLLEQTFHSKKQPNLFFAGQMTELKAMLSQRLGLAVVSCCSTLHVRRSAVFPETTAAIEVCLIMLPMLTAKHSQPMNVNFLALSKSLVVLEFVIRKSK